MSETRSIRVRAAPARLHEEQEHAFILAQLAAHERNPATVEVREEDSDDESDDELGPSEEEERKSSDIRTPAIVWTHENDAVRPHKFVPPHRLHQELPQCTTPLDFFLLFITDDFWEECVTYTNEYAARKHAENDKENNNAAAAAGSSAALQETNTEELKAFVGCLIYMGVVNMDRTRDYWDPITLQPFVASTFPRDRFLWLTRNFRVSEADEPEGPSEDRLFKIRRLINILQLNILKYNVAKAELTIDEAMILFKGRSIMRQHIAKKASPTGFKVWMLVDVITNYVVNLDIFTGMKCKKKEEGATMATVLKLIEPLAENRWYRIGMDGYFTSVALFQELLKKGFYAIGTTRHNRKNFPLELLPEIEDKPRGTFVWRKYGGLVCFSWMDKKPVNILSSFSDPQDISTVKRHTGSKIEEVKCPVALQDYLRTMRGVDVFAQRQSYNKIGRRSMKWFYSLTYFLFDVAIHNSFVLYQEKFKKKEYFETDFRKELMQQLVAGFTARKKRGRPAKHGVKRQSESLHRVVHSKYNGDCKMCRVRLSDGDHGKRSYYKCEDCDVFLCMPDCYNSHVQHYAE